MWRQCHRFLKYALPKLNTLIDSIFLLDFQRAKLMSNNEENMCEYY